MKRDWVTIAHIAMNAPDIAFVGFDRLTVGEYRAHFNTERYDLIPNHRQKMAAKMAVDYAVALDEELTNRMNAQAASKGDENG